MSDATDSRPAADTARQAELSMVAKFFKATELDTRMLGMVGALLLIWILFDIFSGGLFLTPRNLWNLSVQTASIAVMATGMVLIIVTRNIDLSVGSVLGFVGMIMGVTQAEIIPNMIGFDNPFTWILTLAVGVVLGAAIGALHGYIIAFMAVPAFIVTLGGLLVWRGAAWWVTSGRTVAPMDSTFRLLGGGPAGSIGEIASWVFAIIVCIAIILLIANGRRQRKRFKFPLRPMWAETFLATVGCALVLGAVLDSQFLLLAGRHYSQIHSREQSDDCRNRSGHRARHRHSGSGGHHGRCGHDVPGNAHLFWPLCLCAWRQPGGGGPRGHQHALGDREDLHDHGYPVCYRRGHFDSSPERRNKRAGNA